MGQWVITSAYLSYNKWTSLSDPACSSGWWLSPFIETIKKNKVGNLVVIGNTSSRLSTILKIRSRIFLGLAMKGFPATVLLEPILDNSTQGQTNKNMVCLEILSHVMLGLTVQGFPTISSPSTTSGQLYSRGKTKKTWCPTSLGTSSTNAAWIWVRQICQLGRYHSSKWQQFWGFRKYGVYTSK